MSILSITVESEKDKKGLEDLKGFEYGRTRVRVIYTFKEYIYVVQGWTTGWVEE